MIFQTAKGQKRRGGKKKTQRSHLISSANFAPTPGSYSAPLRSGPHLIDLHRARWISTREEVASAGEAIGQSEGWSSTAVIGVRVRVRGELWRRRESSVIVIVVVVVVVVTARRVFKRCYSFVHHRWIRVRHACEAVGEAAASARSESDDSTVGSMIEDDLSFGFWNFAWIEFGSMIEDIRCYSGFASFRE